MTQTAQRRSGAAALTCALVATFACAHGPGSGVPRSIEFEDGDGEALFRIERSGQWVRAEYAGGTLAVVRIEAAGLSVSDRSGAPVGRVEPPGERRSSFRLSPLDASGSVLDLRWEKDGDLEIEDEEDRVVYEAKKRDYGFKVVDGEDRLETKVRSKNGKVSFRGTSGTTYMSTRGPIPLAAAVVLGLEKLRFEHALALSVALMQWPPETK
ncbi:MAG: hypothetical protein ACR2PQ_02340 [Myxococcota bacterium]